MRKIPITRDMVTRAMRAAYKMAQESSDAPSHVTFDDQVASKDPVIMKSMQQGRTMVRRMLVAALHGEGDGSVPRSH